MGASFPGRRLTEHLRGHARWIHHHDRSAHVVPDPPVHPLVDPSAPAQGAGLMKIAITSAALLSLACLPGWSQDWPQLQGNPQRSGYTPDTVKPPFAVAWRHVFAPERVSPFVQAVVSQGRVL